MGKKSIRKTPLVRVSAVGKKPKTLGLGPLPPRMSMTNFNTPCHLTLVRLIWEGGEGSRATRPTFCNGRHMAKKAQIQ